MKTKRLFSILLAVVLICGIFTACGSTTPEKTDTVKISIDEWIGYQSLLDANGGLKTAEGSINAQNGISIEYVVMNDPNSSSAALISGELQGAGYTVNRYAFLQSKFDEAGVDVVMPYITNYSNGGDGVIATSEIQSVKDLVGKKVAVPRYSESQTLVEWLINNSGLTESERKTIRDEMVYFETADETAKAFFSGQVDAAATWEPYLTQAASATDSRILFDTSMSTNLILSGVIFREDFLSENADFMVKLIEGALEASSMYKNEFSNVRQMPMFELMSDAEIIDMAMGADLATWGQNMKLLTEDAVLMYEDMANVWIAVGESAFPKKASEAFTSVYMAELAEKYEGTEEASEEKEFVSDKMQIIESPEALLSYNADIQFELNSYEISPESYAELDEFIKVAKILDGAYIQIEGNASVRADGITEEQIRAFSKERADSVANYFVSKGIERERIITVGNGDSNPLNAENPAAAENRRTEFLFKTDVGY